MLEVHSTKAWHNLPCGHAQFFDKNRDGSQGPCASIHGYDRTVKMTFSGFIDENGWVVPFGGLKPIKQFLEYYFDHTTVLGANDPRVPDIIADESGIFGPQGVLKTLRVLPYGVSMEMSSLFIWEQVNPFIRKLTSGRCYVSKVESIEHEKNSGFITVDRETAERVGARMEDHLVQQQIWKFTSPAVAMNNILPH